MALQPETRAVSSWRAANVIRARISSIACEELRLDEVQLSLHFGPPSQPLSAMARKARMPATEKEHASPSPDGNDPVTLTGFRARRLPLVLPDLAEGIGDGLFSDTEVPLRRGQLRMSGGFLHNPQ